MVRMVLPLICFMLLQNSAQAFDFSRWKAKTLENSGATKTQRIRLKTNPKVTGMAKIRTDSQEIKEAVEFYKTQKPLYQTPEQRVFEQGNGQFHIVMLRDAQPYAIVQVYGKKKFTPGQLKDFKREMTRVPQPAFATVAKPSRLPANLPTRPAR